MDRFNRAFTDREAVLLDDLIAERCVMESEQPAPSGARVVGREACARWCTALVEDPGTRFTRQEVIVASEGPLVAEPAWCSAGRRLRRSACASGLGAGL
ncbi:hypothetical protein ACWGLE_13750 [Streptomyces sp. NPDC055897]